MRLSFRKKSDSKRIARLKKRVRIRKRVIGTKERPRLSVYKSLTHIYAQLIDDVHQVTLESASSLKKDKMSKKDLAKQVGIEIAKKALEKKISRVVFDRSGYVYHGRVQSLADGAREGGLIF